MPVLPPRIMVSGPLTTGDLTPEENYKIAMRVTADLTVRGYAVDCPHHSWVLDRDYGVKIPHEKWMAISLRMLHDAEAVFRILGKSDGSRQEDDAAVGWNIPIFTSYEDLDEWRENEWVRKGSPKPQLVVRAASRFSQELDSWKELHDGKGRDYSPKQEYSNIRAAARAAGCSPARYCYARMQEKMERLLTFWESGSLWNESAVDSFRDIGVFAGIAKVNMDDQHGGT